MKISVCLKKYHPKIQTTPISLEELSHNWDVEISAFKSETPIEYFIRKINEGHFEYLDDKHFLQYAIKNKEEAKDAIDIIKKISIDNKSKKVREKAKLLYDQLL